MPDDRVIEIKGLEELQRAFKASGATMHIALRAGLARGGEIVKDDAKQRVPEETGKLKRAIQRESVQGSGLDQYVKVGIAKVGAQGTKEGQAYRGRSGHKGYLTNPMGRNNLSDPAVYGPYVEEGTRKHTIRPKDAKVLAFPIAYAGPLTPTRKGRAREGVLQSTAFAKSVDHPGTKAQPFLVPALTHNADRIVREIRARTEEVLAKAARGRR